MWTVVLQCEFCKETFTVETKDVQLYDFGVIIPNYQFCTDCPHCKNCMVFVSMLLPMDVKQDAAERMQNEARFT